MKSRYIKQDLDKKGRIKKSSRVVKPYELDEETNFLAWDMFLTLRKQLYIRNLIIVILIVALSVLLIIWR